MFHETGVSGILHIAGMVVAAVFFDKGFPCLLRVHESGKAVGFEQGLAALQFGRQFCGGPAVRALRRRCKSR